MIISSRNMSVSYDRSIVKHTKLEYNDSLSERYSANIYLKREDLQLVRSFKIRGAYAMMSQLSSQERLIGVVAASAGNHAQGVALSCQKLGIRGTIFMPQTTPQQKVRKTKKFGNGMIDIQLIGDNFDETYLAAGQFCQQSGAIFVHPFDDEQVIAGQGTIACEIIDDANKSNLPHIDIIFAAIGGGGLIAGIGKVIKTESPDTKIIGVESVGSSSMKTSIECGQPIKLGNVDTFVDGVAVKQPGKKTFAYVQQYVEEPLK